MARRSSARQAAAGEPEAEPSADSSTADVSHHVRYVEVDQKWMGNVYMVCLKIMVGLIRPWEVNFDRVHLYSRL
jgi:hypothetical protein